MRIPLTSDQEYQWALVKPDAYYHCNPVDEAIAKTAVNLFQSIKPVVNSSFKHRVEWATHPDNYVGRNCSLWEHWEHQRMHSLQEVFEKSYRGLSYLRYVIEGPNLPNEVIESFKRIVDEDAGTSGMVLDQLRSSARSLTRAVVKNEPPSKNEPIEDRFFQLALEFELSRPWGRVIRDESLRAKRSAT